MSRGEDRGVPLDRVPEVARGPADGELRPGDDLALLARPVVVPRDRAAVAAGVDDVRVARLRGDPAALAPADGVPLLAADLPSAGPARDRDGRVVLLRAVDAVGEAVVDGDPVELPRRLVVDRRPGPAAVVGHVGPAVDRPEERDVLDVDRVGALRVGEDLGVVPADSATATAPTEPGRRRRPERPPRGGGRGRGALRESRGPPARRHRAGGPRSATRPGLELGRDDRAAHLGQRRRRLHDLAGSPCRPRASSGRGRPRPR